MASERNGGSGGDMPGGPELVEIEVFQSAEQAEEFLASYYEGVREELELEEQFVSQSRTDAYSLPVW